MKIVRLLLTAVALSPGAAAQVAEDRASGLLLAAAASAELPQGEAQELFLEVILNQMPTGLLGRFLLRDDALFTTAATLRDLGLRWPDGSGDTLVALATIPGLQVDYDRLRQRLNLQADVALLDVQPLRLNGGYAPDELLATPGERLRGLTVNYDLYGQHSSNRYSLSAWHELRLTGYGAGVWSNSVTSRRDAADDMDTAHTTVRLDSSWLLDFPEAMVSLTVGDSITGAVPWSRATRIGGIKLARNFGLQPYRVTAPLLLFQGEAALPSTVDLYINGLRQSSQQVLPGQFELSSTPMLNGFGQAQMVITDIGGQQRTVEFSLYGTPRLLQAGITDWSLEAGTVREQYGQRSFAYDDAPMLSATARHGWSNATTLEGHAEAAEGVRVAGVGGNWMLGLRGGVASAAIATSRHQGESGQQATLGYQWTSIRFNVALNSTRRDAGYRDVASLQGSILPRGSDQAFVGTNTRWGNFGMGFVRQVNDGEDDSRFLNVNWFSTVAGSANFNFGAVIDLEDSSATSYALSFTIPLGRERQSSSTARHRQGATSFTTSVTRQTPADEGGLGWQVEASTGDREAVRAQVNRLGPYGQWQAGFASQAGGAGSTTVYGGASGAVLWAGKQVYAMRQIEEAYALVSTNGVPGVPVKLENRMVGITDANGWLLVNRLNAYQRNKLAIDTEALPADMRVETAALDAVPERRSGVLAEFTLRRILAAQATVLDADGQPLPAGSTLWLTEPDGTERALIVGYDGMIYLEDPPAGAAFHATLATGQCLGTLPQGLPAGGNIDLGTLRCE